MISNRQAGRRNRGRNNGRQNGGNRGDNGNRIDNRARGNAPQLLEKYRNLARDAQLAGDRVNTEYYLQFADHYFRVLADNRARQEEQQARFRRNDDTSFDEGDQSDSSYDREDAFSGSDETGSPDDRRGRGSRESRNAVAREEQPDTQDVTGNSAEAAEEPAPKKRAVRARKPRKSRDEDQAMDKAEAEDATGFDVAALPPAIARADNDSGEDAAVAPRRRGRPRRATAEAAE